MGKHIFISYSKKDSDFAWKLADDLEARGFKTWIDRAIEGGSKWRETIEGALAEADEVIAVLSPNAVEFGVGQLRERGGDRPGQTDVSDFGRGSR